MLEYDCVLFLQVQANIATQWGTSNIALQWRAYTEQGESMVIEINNAF